MFLIKQLLIFIIYGKYCSKDENEIKEEKSIEILNAPGLFDNMNEYQIKI